MKIGPRITLTTVSLVVLTLGLYGTVSVRNRRAELRADTARRMSALGSFGRATIEASLKAHRPADLGPLVFTRPTLEAWLKARRFADLGPLIARWQAAEPEIRFTYIDLDQSGSGEPQAGFQVAGPTDDSIAHDLGGGEEQGERVSVGGQAVYLPPSRDPTRQLRLHRAVVEELPYGELVFIEGRESYAIMEPIRDNGRVVGALELVRDETETELALAESVRNIAYAVLGLAVMLSVLVWISASSGIARPVTRLVEAIDDVTQGDLGRVILRERDDEVGDLAERFNEMTGSLREARKEILVGVDAKLALEARLRHSEKLATIGQLAAGIAHEVGTPLNVISGRARSMEKRAAEALRSADDAPLQPADVAKNAGIIADQTQRITKIIQQLLDFARRPQRVRTRVDLARVTRDAMDFVEHQLAQARIEVTQLPFVRDEDEGDIAAPDGPTVDGDPDQLQQVILNLAVNAIHAMPSGGRIATELRGIVRRRPGLDAAPMLRFVVLSIIDTGVGIPVADRERIFEPFYSTKTDGDGPTGTGLGLAVSNGIVKDHDGWIEIEAPPEGGTVFRVFLPAEV